ncbi:hypothetical protein F3Y22_tig00001957pilonHSYRG00015 [Hibiscus syriacus]|uniref:Uncharacterized protein n=1 Tax=Hibiscus syriacus TaxID=106335 RepID=A0A6A3CSF6_HIBSY|nr:hypothetical protein F3Y22_tig00001957pilonHSYRG00015 [Hibiscus syriacus]
MGNHKQINNIPMVMDAAADDGTSLDSLSFAGLVCIQDQLANSHPHRAYNDKDDHEFEFISGANPPSLDSGSEMSSENRGSEAKVSRRSNRGKKERGGSRSWFGQKLLLSLVSPCRECHAVRPTMKTPTVPQGNSSIKLR